VAGKGCVHTPLDGGSCDTDSACGGVCVAGTCESDGTPTQSACGDVPVTGQCIGGDLVQCILGELVTTSCADVGRLCGWDGSGWGGEGAFACVIGEGQACDAVSDAGSCDGDVLTWCDPATGTTIIEDCAAYDTKCGWTGSYHCCHEPQECVPNCSGRQCGDDGCGGSCGSCDGGKTCSDNGLCGDCDGPDAVCVSGDCGNDNACQTVQCNDQDGCANVALPDGTSCSLDEQLCGGGECKLGYCVPDASPHPDDICGDLPPVGLCDGHVLRKCGDAGPTAVDCAALGLVCGWNPELMDGFGAFGCYAQDQPSCAGVPDSGKCDGSVLTYCSDGEPVVVDCAETNDNCGWTGSFHCCHPPVACVPLCNGRGCGDDGCGGSCGTCADDEYCSESGVCFEACDEAPSAEPHTDEPPSDEPLPAPQSSGSGTPSADAPSSIPTIPGEQVPASGCLAAPSSTGHPAAVLLLLSMLALLTRARRAGRLSGRCHASSPRMHKRTAG